MIWTASFTEWNISFKIPQIKIHTRKAHFKLAYWGKRLNSVKSTVTQSHVRWSIALDCTLSYTEWLKCLLLRYYRCIRYMSSTLRYIWSNSFSLILMCLTWRGYQLEAKCFWHLAPKQSAPPSLVITNKIVFWYRPVLYTHTRTHTYKLHNLILYHWSSTSFKPLLKYAETGMSKQRRIPPVTSVCGGCFIWSSHFNKECFLSIWPV